MSHHHNHHQTCYRRGMKYHHSCCNIGSLTTKQIRRGTRRRSTRTLTAMALSSLVYLFMGGPTTCQAGFPARLPSPENHLHPPSLPSTTTTTDESAGAETLQKQQQQQDKDVDKLSWWERDEGLRGNTNNESPSDNNNNNSDDEGESDLEDVGDYEQEEEEEQLFLLRVMEALSADPTRVSPDDSRISSSTSQEKATSTTVIAVPSISGQSPSVVIQPSSTVNSGGGTESLGMRSSLTAANNNNDGDNGLLLVSEKTSSVMMMDQSSKPPSHENENDTTTTNNIKSGDDYDTEMRNEDKKEEEEVADTSTTDTDTTTDTVIVSALSSQPLRTLHKLQQMLDETDYMMTSRTTTSKERSSSANNSENSFTSATTTMTKESSLPLLSPLPTRPTIYSAQKSILKQPVLLLPKKKDTDYVYDNDQNNGNNVEKLWTSKDRRKYRKLRNRLRKAQKKQQQQQQQQQQPQQQQHQQQQHQPIAISPLPPRPNPMSSRLPVKQQKQQQQQRQHQPPSVINAAQPLTPIKRLAAIANTSTTTTNTDSPLQTAQHKPPPLPRQHWPPPRIQQFLSPLDEEDEESDDDGLGYRLPNLPVYYSDGEEESDDDEEEKEENKTMPLQPPSPPLLDRQYYAPPPQQPQSLPVSNPHTATNLNGQRPPPTPLQPPPGQGFGTAGDLNNVYSPSPPVALYPPPYGQMNYYQQQQQQPPPPPFVSGTRQQPPPLPDGGMEIQTHHMQQMQQEQMPYPPYYMYTPDGYHPYMYPPYGQAGTQQQFKQHQYPYQHPYGAGAWTPDMGAPPPPQAGYNPQQQQQQQLFQRQQQPLQPPGYPPREQQRQNQPPMSSMATSAAVEAVLPAEAGKHTISTPPVQQVETKIMPHEKHSPSTLAVQQRIPKPPPIKPFPVVSRLQTQPRLQPLQQLQPQQQQSIGLTHPPPPNMVYTAPVSLAEASSKLNFDSIQKISLMFFTVALACYAAVSPRTLPLTEYNLRFYENLRTVLLATISPAITLLSVFDAGLNDINAVCNTFFTSFTAGYVVAFVCEILATTAVRLGVFCWLEPKIFQLAPKVPIPVIPWVLRENRYRPKRITLFAADFGTSCVASPIIEEYIKLKVLQWTCQLGRNFNWVTKTSTRGRKRRRVAEEIVRPPGGIDQDIVSANQYITQMLAVSLGLKLCDAGRRILLYTKASDANKSFYAICRGIFPIHELCGTMTALALAKRDLLGVETPLWKILFPAVLIHGMANFRGKKPLFRWGSSTPWSEMQMSPWNVPDDSTLPKLLSKGFAKLMWAIILGRVLGYCIKNYYMINRQAVKRTTTYAGRNAAFKAELATAEMLKRTSKS